MDRIFYVYWDYDDESDKELDISGKAYSDLIDVCFRYADVFAVTFSLRGYNEEKSMECNEKSVFHYCIKQKAINNGHVRCYFTCCQATKRYLLVSYDSLFGWYWNEKECNYLPENLAFYRKDGSCFFASETHEGQCYLYPRKNENFSSVLKTDGWSLGTEGGSCVPSYMKKSWLNPQPNNHPENT